MEMDSQNIDCCGLTPIDQLPDDVLEFIFFLNAMREFVDGRQVYDPRDTTMATLLVCRKWHDVALHYPAIWSRIIDYEKHHPDWILELLRRSKGTAVDVGEDSVFKSVRLRSPRGKTVLSHIFQHSERIRTFSLQMTFSPWELVCKKFLQHPAPSLEYLNLVTSCPFPDCLFPGPLFSEQAPRLKRLHLQRCLVDFSSPTLFNLTELSIMDVLSPNFGVKYDHPLKFAPTVAGWLRILSNIPSLKYLTLSTAISHSTAVEECPFLDLPNLEFLTIGARFRDAEHFLSNISLSSSCGIRLRVSRDKSSPSSKGTKLLYFLNSRLAFWAQDGTDRYLQAKILSGNRIHFGNSRRVGYIWDMTESEVLEEHSLHSLDPLLWLVVSFEDPDDTIRFFNQILSMYSSTYASTTFLELWLDDEYTFDNTLAFPPLEILRSFTAVKTLNLLGPSPLYFLPLFQNSSSPNHPLFPALRSLRLTRTKVEEGIFSDTYTTVVAFLKWRAQELIPLTDFQIVDGIINKETEESISRIGKVKVTSISSTGLGLDYDYSSDESVEELI